VTRPATNNVSAQTPHPVERIDLLHTAVPGRVRLRVRGLYRRRQARRKIEELLGREPWIRSVSASTLTGNVLILFDRERALDDVLALAEEAARRFADGFHPEPPLYPRRQAQRDREPGRAIEQVPVRSLRESLRRFLGRPEPKQARPAPGARRTAAPEEQTPAWHTLEASEALSFWKTPRETGLEASEAARRLAAHGPNVLPRPEAAPPWKIFFSQFESLPVVLLIGSSVLSIATGGVGDAVVILGVVFLNAAVGTLTETHAEKSIASLTDFGEPAAVVLRGGQTLEIPGEEVVVGDVLVLTRGRYISADARLIEAGSLTIDESVLTGESVPAAKTVKKLEERVLALGDRANMAFRGTVVTGGSGLAVVVAAGERTEIGKIQALMAAAEQPETPIQIQLHRLGNQLVALAGAICGGVLLVGLVRGYGLLEMIKTAVSLAVASIPEGLPAVATTTLAYGMQRLRGHGILVRRLQAVETLGSVQTMCLDKTGTITRNRMTVVEVFAGMEKLRIDGGRLFSGEEPVDAAAHSILLRLLDVAVLCNEAELDQDPEGPPRKGSPTEAALLRAAVAARLDTGKLRKDYPLEEIEHRTESRNYMVTRHQTPDGGRFVAVKGNPSEVLELCGWILEDGEISELDEDVRSAIRAANERMAGSALRVLGMAYRQSPPAAGQAGESEDDGEPLIWAGMMGLADPPREGIEDVIAALRRAGVRTIMLTGDQSATAYAVGKQLDLAGGQDLEIIDSNSLEQIEPELLSALVGRAHIFSRVNPSHKLQIVQALQSRGEVVAMTGDGVNDGPALKAANVGVAMGKGAEVAREVADVIVAREDLGAMAAAIAEGRTRYDDIKKAIHFIVSSNLSEVLVTFGSIALGLGQPLNPRQLLWINLLTDVFPELALAVEPPESDVLISLPRDPSRQLFSKPETLQVAIESGTMTVCALACYGLGIARYGAGPRAGSIAFLSLTTAQLLHTISSRSERHTIFDDDKTPENRYVPMAIGSGLLIELAGQFVPALRALLGSAPVGARDLALAGGGGVSSFLLNEALKFLLVRRGRIEPVKPPEPGPQQLALEFEDLYE